MHKLMTVTMPNGEIWGVPVDMIARSRATYYAHDFDGDVERSLAEDTIPLFESDEYEIQDWAENNMNWSDFNGHQIKVCDTPDPDLQEAWINGGKGFVR